MHHFWKSGIYSLSSDTCVKRPTVSQALAPSLGVASSALSCSAPLVLSRCEDCLSWFPARHCGFALPMFCLHFALFQGWVVWKGEWRKAKRSNVNSSHFCFCVRHLFLPHYHHFCHGSSHTAIEASMRFFFSLGLMNEKKKSKTNWKQQQEIQGKFWHSSFLGVFCPSD